MLKLFNITYNFHYASPSSNPDFSLPVEKHLFLSKNEVLKFAVTNATTNHNDYNGIGSSS